MPFIELPDLRLRYETAGAGSPVILLHGLGSSADDWRLQESAFAAAHQLITLDLRGHGQSAWAGPLTIPLMARDVATVLARLAAGPAHVVGLSLGGCVALALAQAHPAAVRSLTLVNTFAVYRPAGAGGVFRVIKRLWLLAFGSPAAMAGFIAQGLFPKPEQAPLRAAAIASLGRNGRRAYWQAIQALRRFDARAGLSALRCPTLVVTGDRDTTVPRTASAALAAGIPGARQVWLADSGHASPIDQPAAFNAAVLDFLRQVEAGRP